MEHGEIIPSSPRVTLYKINFTWTAMGSNPGLHGDRPARNRLSHGMVDETHSTVQCLHNTVIR